MPFAFPLWSGSGFVRRSPSMTILSSTGSPGCPKCSSRRSGTPAAPEGLRDVGCSNALLKASTMDVKLAKGDLAYLDYDVFIVGAGERKTLHETTRVEGVGRPAGEGRGGARPAPREAVPDPRVPPPGDRPGAGHGGHGREPSGHGDRGDRGARARGLQQPPRGAHAALQRDGRAARGDDGGEGARHPGHGLRARGPVPDLREGDGGRCLRPGRVQDGRAVVRREVPRRRGPPGVRGAREGAVRRGVREEGGGEETRARGGGGEGGEARGGEAGRREAGRAQTRR